MTRIVRAFPLRDTEETQLERFAEDLRANRASDMLAFLTSHSVARETWHIQQTPQGRWAIVVTELDGREANVVAAEYQVSESPFDTWFKSKVLELTGVDPNQDPLGPPTTLVFDSSTL